jgi:hypothetical protein
MSSTDKLVMNFLNELHSNSSQEMFEKLAQLIEHLENKADPEPTDVLIVDNIYQTLEKLKTLDSILVNYIGESNNVLKGNKLQDLYDSTPTYVGSQVLFD